MGEGPTSDPVNATTDQYCEYYIVIYITYTVHVSFMYITYIVLHYMVFLLFFFFLLLDPGPVQDIKYSSSSDGSLLNVSFSTDQLLSNGVVLEYVVSLILYTGGKEQVRRVNASVDAVLVQFNGLGKIKSLI